MFDPTQIMEKLSPNSFVIKNIVFDIRESVVFTLVEKAQQESARNSAVFILKNSHENNFFLRFLSKTLF